MNINTSLLVGDQAGGRPAPAFKAKRTKKERVEVPIARRLLRPLRALRRRSNGQYVFGRMLDGEWRPVENPNKALAAAAALAGLKRVTCHTLRHTSITHLVQNGVPLWQVAQWVGTSVEMIERHYGHHSPERFQDVHRVLG